MALLRNFSNSKIADGCGLKKEEGRGNKEEGRGKKEEGRGKKEEVKNINIYIFLLIGFED